jgi:hypothetical protein
MVAIDVAAATAVTASSSAITAANNLRIASIAIAAYEYVTSGPLLNRTLIAFYIRPVIFSLSLPNSGYTKLQVDVGKKVVAQNARIAR